MEKSLNQEITFKDFSTTLRFARNADLLRQPLFFGFNIKTIDFLLIFYGCETQGYLKYSATANRCSFIAFTANAAIFFAPSIHKWLSSFLPSGNLRKRPGSM